MDILNFADVADVFVANSIPPVMHLKVLISGILKSCLVMLVSVLVLMASVIHYRPRTSFTYRHLAP
jgi:hypothetical protein